MQFSAIAKFDSTIMVKAEKCGSRILAKNDDWSQNGQLVLRLDTTSMTCTLQTYVNAYMYVYIYIVHACMSVSSIAMQLYSRLVYKMSARFT